MSETENGGFAYNKNLDDFYITVDMMIGSGHDGWAAEVTYLILRLKLAEDRLNRICKMIDIGKEN